MELKEKLVALRKEKGLTQSAVAEKLDVSRQAISRWESGIALPSTDNLKSLSALYGVPVDYLLNSDTEEQRVTKGLEAENTQAYTIPHHCAQRIQSAMCLHRADLGATHPYPGHNEYPSHPRSGDHAPAHNRSVIP